jgi:hypothetical protein
LEVEVKRILTVVMISIVLFSVPLQVPAITQERSDEIFQKGYSDRIITAFELLGAINGDLETVKSEITRMRRDINDTESLANRALSLAEYDAREITTIKTADTTAERLGYRIEGTRHLIELAENNIKIHNYIIIALAALVIVQFVLLFLFYRKFRNFTKAHPVPALAAAVMSTPGADTSAKAWEHYISNAVKIPEEKEPLIKQVVEEAHKGSIDAKPITKDSGTLKSVLLILSLFAVLAMQIFGLFFSAWLSPLILWIVAKSMISGKERLGRLDEIGMLSFVIFYSVWFLILIANEVMYPGEPMYEKFPNSVVIGGWALSLAVTIFITVKIFRNPPRFRNDPRKAPREAK